MCHMFLLIITWLLHIYSFARSAAAIKALCHLIPNFQKKVDEAEPDDLEDFYAQVCCSTYVLQVADTAILTAVIQLQDGAINARGDDVSKLMSRVASWLNQQYPKEVPLLDDSRIGRGIHHPITGMLLCPIRYDWSDEQYGFLLVLNSNSLWHWQCSRQTACGFSRLRLHYRYLHSGLLPWIQGLNGWAWTRLSPEWFARQGLLSSLLLSQANMYFIDI